MLYDSGPTMDRIIILGTQKNLEVLKNSQNWFSDGTFKSCPKLFSQLYTIHAQVETKVVPCIFALLPDKTEETYVKLLRVLQSMIQNGNPRNVTTDFELASIQAFLTVFPNSKNNGCLFHFGQCIFRHIQQIPLLLQRLF